MAKGNKGFQKGNPGKQKGAINVLTRTVKDAFIETFGQLQLKKGVNLVEWAEKNPNEFYKLSTKLIPQIVEAKIDAEIKGEQTFKWGDQVLKFGG